MEKHPHFLEQKHRWQRVVFVVLLVCMLHLVLIYLLLQVQKNSNNYSNVNPKLTPSLHIRWINSATTSGKNTITAANTPSNTAKIAVLETKLNPNLTQLEDMPKSTSKPISESTSKPTLPATQTKQTPLPSVLETKAESLSKPDTKQRQVHPTNTNHRKTSQNASHSSHTANQTAMQALTPQSSLQQPSHQSLIEQQNVQASKPLNQAVTDSKTDNKTASSHTPVQVLQPIHKQAETKPETNPNSVSNQQKIPAKFNETNSILTNSASSSIPSEVTAESKSESADIQAKEAEIQTSSTPMPFAKVLEEQNRWQAVSSSSLSTSTVNKDDKKTDKLGTDNQNTDKDDANQTHASLNHPMDTSTPSVQPDNQTANQTANQSVNTLNKLTEAEQQPTAQTTSEKLPHESAISEQNPSPTAMPFTKVLEEQNMWQAVSSESSKASTTPKASTPALASSVSEASATNPTNLANQPVANSSNTTQTLNLQTLNTQQTSWHLVPAQLALAHLLTETDAHPNAHPHTHPNSATETNQDFTTNANIHASNAVMSEQLSNKSPKPDQQQASAKQQERIIKRLPITKLPKELQQQLNYDNTVELMVEFHIDIHGHVKQQPAPSIVQTSGYPAIDEHSLQMVSKFSFIGFREQNTPIEVKVQLPMAYVPDDEQGQNEQHHTVPKQ